MGTVPATDGRKNETMYTNFWTWTTNLYYTLYIYLVPVDDDRIIIKLIHTFSLLIFMTRLADNDLIFHSSNSTKCTKRKMSSSTYTHTVYIYGFIHLCKKQGQALGWSQQSKTNVIIVCCVFVYLLFCVPFVWLNINGWSEYDKWHIITNANILWYYFVVVVEKR